MKPLIPRAFRVVFAGLLILSLQQQASSGQTATPPIELSDVTLEYQILDSAGRPKWVMVDTRTIDSVPAHALKLRLKATVKHRPPGAKLRLKATLHETCYPSGSGKKFFTKHRHLAENAAAGEELVISPQGTVQVELPTECHDCGDRCGSDCPDRDHLGEGPHGVTLVASDAAPQAADDARTNTTQKLSPFLLQFGTKCPPRVRSTPRRP